jgi:hypothetical protein
MNSEIYLPFYCCECCTSRVRADILRELPAFILPRVLPTEHILSGYVGDHLLLSDAKVKNAWNYTSTPAFFSLVLDSV